MEGASDGKPTTKTRKERRIRAKEKCTYLRAQLLSLRYIGGAVEPYNRVGEEIRTPPAVITSLSHLERDPDQSSTAHPVLGHRRVPGKLCSRSSGRKRRTVHRRRFEPMAPCQRQEHANATPHQHGCQHALPAKALQKQYGAVRRIQVLLATRQRLPKGRK